MANKKRLICLDDLLKYPIRITHYDMVNGNRHFVLGIESILEYAENLPTVDAVEVVHGEWIDKYEIKSFRHTNIPVVQCSKCECYFCDIINNHHFMYHYCPNCGAKMDGDGNG